MSKYDDVIEAAKRKAESEVALNKIVNSLLEREVAKSTWRFLEEGRELSAALQKIGVRARPIKELLTTVHRDHYRIDHGAPATMGWRIRWDSYLVFLGTDGNWFNYQRSERWLHVNAATETLGVAPSVLTIEKDSTWLNGEGLNHTVEILTTFPGLRLSLRDGQFHVADLTLDALLTKTISEAVYETLANQ